MSDQKTTPLTDDQITEMAIRSRLLRRADRPGVMIQPRSRRPPPAGVAVTQPKPKSPVGGAHATRD